MSCFAVCDGIFTTQPTDPGMVSQEEVNTCRAQQPEREDPNFISNNCDTEVLEMNPMDVSIAIDSYIIAKPWIWAGGGVFPPGNF